MVGRFSGVFAGYEKKKGKRGDYYVLRFLDECGKIFECVSRDDDVVSCLEKFESIDFFAQVDVGSSYTKITFLGIS